jgi:hydrogenase 3 maturation protease
LLTAEVKQTLTPEKIGATLIITVGNSLRSDDGIGPYIANNFKGNAKFTLLNAGDKPENAVDKASQHKPAKTVIIDAANFGGKVGEARIIPGEAIPNTTLSTHTFPLKVISKIIAEDTKSKVYFLGIQPKSVELGEKMDPAVVETAKEILKCMKCT